MLNNFSNNKPNFVPKHDIDVFNLEEKYFSMKKENEKFFFPWALENTEPYSKSTLEEIKKLETEEEDLSRKIELVRKKISALRSTVNDYQ